VTKGQKQEALARALPLTYAFRRFASADGCTLRKALKRPPLSGCVSRSLRDMSTLLRFEPAGAKWWRKPLVRHENRTLPAELAILIGELSVDESGAWLNSRGLDSGVADLISSDLGAFKTKRIPLPPFVSEQLKKLYLKARVKKGCPDLVIWNQMTKRMRLVEVKCPHWDRPSQEQRLFIEAAESSGIAAKIVEWEFQAVTG
jgi:hypothetical protein